MKLKNKDVFEKFLFLHIRKSLIRALNDKRFKRSCLYGLIWQMFFRITNTRLRIGASRYHVYARSIILRLSSLRRNNEPTGGSNPWLVGTR